MPIVVLSCPKCSYSIKVPDYAATQQMYCPSCGTVLQPTQAKEAKTPDWLADLAKAEKPTPLRSIKVVCSNCGTRLKAAESRAGREVTCPRCRAAVPVSEHEPPEGPPEYVLAEAVAEVPIAVEVRRTEEESQPTGKGDEQPARLRTPRSSLLPWIIAGSGALVGLVGIILAATFATRQTTPQVAEQKPALEIVSKEVDLTIAQPARLAYFSDGPRSRMFLIGHLKNDSGKTMKTATVKLNVVDNAGNHLDTKRASTNDLAPGATWKFEVPLDRNHTYHAMGGSIVEAKGITD
jgi:hypothetical protein